MVIVALLMLSLLLLVLVAATAVVLRLVLLLILVDFFVAVSVLDWLFDVLLPFLVAVAARTGTVVWFWLKWLVRRPVDWMV